jgi:glycosyltransferase involved in cell wall biosynthesis
MPGARVPSESARICIVPRLAGVGGMVSFRARLSAGLEGRGIRVTDDVQSGADAVLVIGGTRQLGGLWRARRGGARIVQRLNGMNWLHRQRRTGLRHFIRSGTGNWLLATIRSRLAHTIVYQSEFSRGWWERVYGPTPAAYSVIYNAVDLTQFTPHGAHTRPEGKCRILLVEGSLMGGYEYGLEAAAGLAGGLAGLEDFAYSRSYPEGVELMVAGRVAPEVSARWQARSPVPIQWAGLLPAQAIPALDRSAHLLYSADINAACPNAVIEALACGLPVLAFDTGALPELVEGGAGRVVPYGGDPWKLDPPDLPALTQAALDILVNLDDYRAAARRRAEDLFGLDRMLDAYIKVLLS